MKKLFLLLVLTFIGFIGNAQIINIPDSNFKHELLISNIVNGIAQDLNGENLTVDANGNNEIEVSEALQVSFLNLNFKHINSLSGIAYFTNLKTLDCSGNPLTALDVSALTLLEILNCEYSNINALNLNGLIHLQTLTCQESHLNSLSLNGLVSLTYLRCDTNNLTALNVSGLTSLVELQCDDNQLTSLVLSGATQLQTLNCKSNQISTLNINGLVNLYSLECSSNQITSLILVGFPNLSSVYCANNLITTLDLRELPNISILYCAENLLTTLYLNNGTAQNPFVGSFGNNTTLTLVCIDAEEAIYFQNYTATISTSCPAFNFYFVSHDDNFLAKLLQANTTNNIAKDINGNAIKIDNNNDLRIDENEIANVYQLDVSNASITDMYGIRRFTHLTKLICKTNQMNSLDLSSLTNLAYLDCSFNSIISLNTSTLTNLQTLLVNNNQIGGINLAAQVGLQNLNCSNNQLATLNINALLNLTTLNCSANALTTLNIETLTSLANLNCSSNNLTSLYLKNGVSESSLIFNGNPGLIYICCDAAQTSQVQALITSYGYTNCTLASSCTFAGALFADPNFNNKLLQAATNNFIAKDLTGNWTKIDTNNNGVISTSEAQSISYLDINNAQISSLAGINNFYNLKTLICANNQLTSLNLSTLSLLVTLDCSGNQLETLNINDLTHLVTLSCAGNSLIALSVSGLSSLQTINCSSNQILALNATGLTNLQNLNTSLNQLQTLNVNGLTNLLTLSTATNLLTNLDVSGLTNLQFLSCYGNQMTTLNVNGLTNLQELYCGTNQLPSLNLSSLTNVQKLDCSNNLLTALNLNNLTNLQNINFSNNQLSTIDLSSQANLRVFDCSYNQFQTIDVTGLATLQNFNCSVNAIVSLNLTGLSALQILDCSGNPLGSLSVNHLSNLQTLQCNFNQLQTLDVSGMINLTSLGCRFNQLSTVNISGAINLQSLNCSNNLLTTLDLAGFVQLNNLECGENALTSINLQGLTNLQTLKCYSNSFTALDLTGLVNLYWLDCQHNQITTLNVNGFTNLWYLMCENNPLISLYIKTGHYISELNYYSNTPVLEYICVDEEQIAAIETRNAAFGYTNCHVNSYCTFTPGGTYYTIQGNTKHDSNNNGCDAADLPYPNLKLSFSDGTHDGHIIADGSGNYHNTVEVGTHTFAPVLENPSYFMITPATSSVTFPAATSPSTRDFCVAPNGIHNDLEIAVIPMNNARPGFDTTYKILYKNKGTQSQSSFVTLTFDDTKMDLVAATPNTSSQAVNSLSWSFSNLQPFESRTILVTFNLNTPSETPALNSGEILNYTASINGISDETLDDNIASVSQEVVNSFDPNEKTCVEGKFVTQNLVGQDVHYVIRFENNGTANAQNIVIKDVIDTTKYDINSLIPLAGSVAYVTRIKNTNQVEFIFENINLPFDDANNDGFVAFKIKTKPTLLVGDSFSNTANIYFDYNFPITTNTATTTIAALGSPDFEFNSAYTLSPVPAKNILNITTKQTRTLRSASIYNQLGQLILVTTTPKIIDVSALKAGSYFIKVVSDNGSATTKFLKE